MKNVNWNTIASVVAALCGVLTVSLVPLAQSWLDQKFQLQAANVRAESDAKYETQTDHAKDMDRLATVTEKLDTQQQQTQTRVQKLEDANAIISRRNTIAPHQD